MSNNKDDFIYLIIGKLRFPIILIISVYLISVTGFMIIPGQDFDGKEVYMSVFDAVFVTVYTSTTIGFGESPYPWTYPQKLWVSIVAIISVISWLYSIGKIISIAKDKRIKNEKNRYFFKRAIEKLDDSFYIVCGFGNTGRNLIKTMTYHGINVVLIDRDEMVVDSINLYSYCDYVTAITGDITSLTDLKLVGLEHKNCKGFIVTTDDDDANVKATISAKILNKDIKIISKANSFDTYLNMKSYNIDYPLNLGLLFSKVILKIVSDNLMYRIETLLTNESFDFMNHQFPNKNWIIVGYTNYGKNLYKGLEKNGIKSNVISNIIDEDFIMKNENFFIGEGVIDHDLIEANIKNTDVFVATTKNDHINLSSIITAKKLNKNLKTIAIVNDVGNKELFKKINVDYIFQPYEILVRNVFTIISEPLTKKFIKYINFNFSEDDKNDFLEKISHIEHEDMTVWSFSVNDLDSPCLIKDIKNNKSIYINDIVFNEKYYRLNTIPLIIKRGKNYLLDLCYKTKIEDGDNILFLGTLKSKSKMEWIIKNRKVFEINKELNEVCF